MSKARAKSQLKWIELFDINQQRKVVPERRFRRNDGCYLELFSGGWSCDDFPTLEWWWKLRAGAKVIATLDTVDPGVLPFTWATEQIWRFVDGNQSSSSEAKKDQEKKSG